MICDGSGERYGNGWRCPGCPSCHPVDTPVDLPATPRELALQRAARDRGEIYDPWAAA